MTDTPDMNKPDEQERAAKLNEQIHIMFHQVLRQAQAAYSAGLLMGDHAAMEWLEAALEGPGHVPIEGSDPWWYAHDAWEWKPGQPDVMPAYCSTAAEGPTEFPDEADGAGVPLGAYMGRLLAEVNGRGILFIAEVDGKRWATNMYWIVPADMDGLADLTENLAPGTYFANGRTLADSVWSGPVPIVELLATLGEDDRVAATRTCLADGTAVFQRAGETIVARYNTTKGSPVYFDPGRLDLLAGWWPDLTFTVNPSDLEGPAVCISAGAPVGLLMPMRAVHVE